MSNSNIKKDSFKSGKIKILFDTNLNEDKQYELKYDMIYDPTSNQIPQTKEKLDYPFFTADVRYSKKILESKSYSEIVRAFFSKIHFNEIVQKFKENESDNGDNDTKKIDRINHNILMMLLFLFPTRFPLNSNIVTSYDTLICRTSTKEDMTLNSGIFSGVSFLGKKVEDQKIREYSYLNIDGKVTVTKVTWLNDILNDSKYRELIDKLIQYNYWKEEKMGEKKDETVNEKFTDKDINLLTEIKDGIQLKRAKEAGRDKNNIDRTIILEYNRKQTQLEDLIVKMASFNTAIDENDFNKASNLIHNIDDEFVKRQSKIQINLPNSFQTKVNNIVNKFDKINARALLNEKIFSTNGINLDYDKDESEDGRKIKKEVEKDEYKVFRNTVKFIKDKFTKDNRESMNPLLRRYVDEYFDDKTNTFGEIIDSADAYIQNITKKKIDCNDKQFESWNTLVTRLKPTNDNDPEYEISLHIEVIKGEINYETEKTINCDYRDKILLTLFDSLLNKTNRYEMVKESTATELPNSTNDEKLPKKKGGKRRTVRKHKKRRTLKRL